MRRVDIKPANETKLNTTDKLIQKLEYVPKQTVVYRYKLFIYKMIKQWFFINKITDVINVICKQ